MADDNVHYTFYIKQHPNQTLRGTLSFPGEADPLATLFRSNNLTKNSEDNGAESKLNIIISDPGLNQTSQPNVDYDAFGASSFVIAVVLIYGLSIVFLIASHVVVKKKEFYKDSEKQISKYLEQAPQLREESDREHYRKLKRSLLPMIAQSPSSRGLLLKTLKNAPYLMQSLPMTLLATTGVPHSKPIPHYPPGTMFGQNNLIKPPQPNITTECEVPVHSSPNRSIAVNPALDQSLDEAPNITSSIMGNVVVYVDSDSDEEHHHIQPDDEHSEENALLYGGKSLQDILEADEEEEQDKQHGNNGTVV